MLPPMIGDYSKLQFEPNGAECTTNSARNQLILSSLASIDKASALASPRRPLSVLASATTFCSVASDFSGCRRAETVFESKASTALPSDNSRGLHLAPALNSLATTSPPGIGLVPVRPPQSSPPNFVCLYSPLSRISNSFGKGCTRPRESKTAYSSE